MCPLRHSSKSKVKKEAMNRYIGFLFQQCFLEVRGKSSYNLKKVVHLF